MQPFSFSSSSFSNFWLQISALGGWTITHQYASFFLPVSFIFALCCQCSKHLYGEYKEIGCTPYSLLSVSHIESFLNYGTPLSHHCCDRIPSFSPFSVLLQQRGTPSLLCCAESAKILSQLSEDCHPHS